MGDLNDAELELLRSESNEFPHDIDENELIGDETNIKREDSELYDEVITPSSNLNDSKNESMLNTPTGSNPAPTFPSNGTSNQNGTGRRYCCYVGGMAWWTTDADLNSAFTSLGVHDLIDIKFYENRTNGQSKGYCLCVFGSENSVKMITEQLPKKPIHSMTLVVLPYTKASLAKFEETTSRTSIVKDKKKEEPAAVINMGTIRIGGGPPVMSGPSGGPPIGPGPMGPGPMGMRPQGPVSMSGPGGPMQGPPMGGPMMGRPVPLMMNNMQPPMQIGGPQGPMRGPGSMMGPGGHMMGGPMGGPPQGMPPNMQGPPPQQMGMNPMMNQMNMNRPPPGQTGPPGISGGPMMSGPPNIQMQMGGMRPPGSQGHMGMPPGAHINPQVYPGFQGNAPPGVMQSQMNNGPPGMRPPAGRGGDGPMSENEFEDVMNRNRTVSSSAISRAISDASNGEVDSAMETLLTAISLIKSSRVAHDDRCKLLITSLQDTLSGIESKSSLSHSSSRKHRRDRDRSRSRSRDRDRKRHRRSRSRSRSRDRRRH